VLHTPVCTASGASDDARLTCGGGSGGYQQQSTHDQKAIVAKEINEHATGKISSSPNNQWSTK